MGRISVHRGSHRLVPRRGLRRAPLRFETLEGRVLLSALVSGDESVFAANGAAAAGEVAAGLPAVMAPETEGDGPSRLQSAALPRVQKLIVAGDPSGSPPDTPSDRVDANSTASPYAGVGSLAISLDPFLFICTGAAISPTHVLTAAHCLDLDDNGSIDVAPGDVQFHLNYGSNLSHTRTGAALFVHPDWTGFGNPAINDDVAVIALSAPLPAGVPIYPLNTDPFVAVETATLVGYGRSGDGVSGYYVSPSFSVKRAGGNLTDFYDVDDEGSGAREIFQFDFDGLGYDFSFTPGLGNDVETTLGGGDSGGPAFIDDGAGGLEIFGINTHGFGFFNPMPLFGSGGGGIVVAEYVDWINSIIGEQPEPAAPLVLETGVLPGVGNGRWTTVHLQNSYDAMVVVASANYDATGPAGVVRIRNASGSSFEVRVDSTGGAAIDGVSVHYLVVEEGVYTAEEHGVTMEAVSFTSTVTDRKGSWNGQSRSYSNAYGNPIVVGQVMSYNDPDYSVFWAAGSERTAPPSSSFLRVGKHVGEDPDTTRANEAVGYVVIEAGGGTLSDGRALFAALGPEIVRGVGNAPPYVYSPGASFDPAAAVVSLSGMNGGDGGWAVLYGAEPATATALKLAVDEDQNDAERSHTTEQVAYVLFSAAPGAEPGITVTPTSGLVTTESGATATFEVVLDTQPAADVTIGISSSDTTEGTVSSTGLVFTAANWNVPQTVTVTGVDDAADDGNVAYQVITAAASSSDSDYGGLDADDVSVTNVDDDTAGITVSPTSGLVTSETGGSDTFRVVLDSQPAADVTIGLSSSDPSEGTLSVASLTFTPGNWAVPQTITVTGVDDGDLDGAVGYSIVTGPAASADSQYDGLNPADVAATNLDDESPPPSGTLTLERGFVAGVSNTGWTTVTLQNTYTSMVVVASVNYKGGWPPLVARVRNAGGGSFQVRADRADGSGAAAPLVNVAYLVVEEGVYTAAQHGVTMEAVKFTSSVTDGRNAWGGAIRPYANTYTAPVVVGQVMSYNDTDFSVFWAAGASALDPPSGSVLRVGKHVGEDPDTTRADEIIGYVVIESGTGTIGSLHYEAGVGADSVTGIDDAPPTVYSMESIQPSGGVVSQAGMDGNNGGWPILYGTNPITPAGVKLAIDEDQLSDAERNHTPEQVAYLIFGTPVSAAGTLRVPSGPAQTARATRVTIAVPPSAPAQSAEGGEREDSGPVLADETREGSRHVVIAATATVPLARRSALWDVAPNSHPTDQAIVELLAELTAELCAAF